MQRHSITPTTFGLWAMNDSRFVFDVRAGRDCMGSTIRRVLAFMAEYEAKQEAKRLRLAQAEQGSGCAKLKGPGSVTLTGTRA